MPESKKLEQLRRNVTAEYEAFKSNMLQNKPEVIYNSFDEIGFYDSLYTYLTNYENISQSFIDRIHNKPNIIELVKSVYYETDIPIHTWGSISELLEVYSDSTA